MMKKLINYPKNSFAEIWSSNNWNEVNKWVRNTHWLQLDTEDKKEYDLCIKSAKKQINDFFWVKLKESEWLSVLGYEPGWHYSLHSDSCWPAFDNNWKFTKWERTRKTREITTIVFLWDSTITTSDNTKFIWWNVSFDYLKDINGKSFLFTPKKWTLLAFPSNPYFSHTVHEVIAWYRVTLVEWFDADYL